MKVRYTRVSTFEQNESRQTKIDDLKLYSDKINGSVPFAQRPQGAKLLKDITKANNNITDIVVTNVNRLGRSNIDILQTIEFFTQNNINLHIEDLNIDSLVQGKPNPLFNLVIGVLTSLAQMQKEEIKESQRQGIANAKKDNKYDDRAKRGGANKENQLHKYKDVIRDLKTKKYSINELSKRLYFIYDKKYYSMTANELRAYKGQTVTRATLSNIKKNLI